MFGVTVDTETCTEKTRMNKSCKSKIKYWGKWFLPLYLWYFSYRSTGGLIRSLGIWWTAAVKRNIRHNVGTNTIRNKYQNNTIPGFELAKDSVSVHMKSSLFGRGDLNNIENQYYKRKINSQDRKVHELLFQMKMKRKQVQIDSMAQCNKPVIYFLI